MNDLISRQDAIDAIEHRLAEPEYQHTGEDWYAGMNCAESEIYDLPSAQQWIPCSDRLPEEYGSYLTFHEDGRMEVGTYSEFGWGFGHYVNATIAWMPLPQPWKEVENE